jgi:hypothetical protein
MALGYGKAGCVTRPADYGDFTECTYRKGDAYFRTYFQYQRVQVAPTIGIHSNTPTTLRPDPRVGAISTNESSTIRSSAAKVRTVGDAHCERARTLKELMHDSAD